MVRNRTEELERRLDEVEATVRGLTEELVEAHGRISELEDRLDDGEDDPDAEAPTKRMTDAEKDRTERAAQADDSSDGTDEEADLDDIIVA
ncbi:MAG: hypothetical protein R3324_17950 [Halobacteriales archaeon]|nr:hypothetical protein [Halobacteriales archaeon]